jgi:hypothetical protein
MPVLSTNYTVKKALALFRWAGGWGLGAAVNARSPDPICYTFLAIAPAANSAT